MDLCEGSDVGDVDGELEVMVPHGHVTDAFEIEEKGALVVAAAVAVVFFDAANGLDFEETAYDVAVAVIVVWANVVALSEETSFDENTRAAAAVFDAPSGQTLPYSFAANQVVVGVADADVAAGYSATRRCRSASCTLPVIAVVPSLARSFHRPGSFGTCWIDSSARQVATVGVVGVVVHAGVVADTSAATLVGKHVADAEVVVAGPAADAAVAGTEVGAAGPVPSPVQHHHHRTASIAGIAAIAEWAELGPAANNSSHSEQSTADLVAGLDRRATALEAMRPGNSSRYSHRH